LNLPGQEGCSSIAGMAAYDFLLWDFPTHRFACAWDTGKASVIQQQVKNVNYVTRAVMRLGDHQAVVEFTGSKVESMRAGSNIQLIPNTAALTSATSLNYALFRNPTSAATYDMVFNRLVAVFPTLEARRGLPISYRWRCMDCGRREIATETETGRLFAGLDGPIPFIDGWDYRAGASTAYSDSESTLGSGYIWRNTRRDASGTIVVNGIVDALNSGVINPFLLPGQTQTAAGLAAIAATSAAGTKLYQGRYSVRQIDASASGPLWKLPAGEIMAAVGVDFRTETFKFTGNPSPNGRIESEILGAPFDNGNALDGKTRDIKAAYTEILIPVLRQLEVTAAVRRDDYSGFGATTNPKYSFKFTPGAGLLFRGSYNTGFRVPSFNQIFNAPVESPYLGADLADPSKCPGGRPISNRPGCELISPLIIGGGKPDLGPETASQQSLGFVWDVTKNVSINVDWWSIDRKKTIQSFDIRTLVDNFGLFPERFIRNAAGNVAAIDTRWINAGQTITKGLEIGARANWSGLGGRWSTGLDGTYLLEKKSRLLASAPFGSSEVGVFTYGGDLGIRWKHNAFLTYKTGAWSTSMSQIYRRGYANNLLPGVVSGVVLPPDLNRRVDD
jgi:iron complex outermembrane receptor protein